jgi:hypothetical protein
MRAAWWENTLTNVALIADKAPQPNTFFYVPSPSKISNGFGLFVDNLEASAPVITRIRAAYVDPNNWQTGVLPDSGGTQQIPNIAIEPSLNALLADWRGLPKANAARVLLHRKANETGIIELSGAPISQNRGGNVGLDFVRFPADEPHNIGDSARAETDSLKLRLEFRALQVFTINRGSWWMGSLLRGYLSGPYSGSFSAETFFGDTGLLRLIPIQIVVSYQPTATVVVNTNFYQNNKNAFHSQDGVIIGPWLLGGSGGHVEIDQIEGEGKTTITLSTQDTNPYVVGVLSERFTNPKSEQSGSVTVKNSGIFIASLSVSYVQDGVRKTKKTDNFPILVSKTIQLPQNAQDIEVLIKIATFIGDWSDLFSHTFPHLIEKKFELTGTTFKPTCTEL